MKNLLPDLTYGYSALEPHYSARPLELHHSKHHAAYVAGANTTLEKLATAREHRKFEATDRQRGLHRSQPARRSDG